MAGQRTTRVDSLPALFAPAFVGRRRELDALTGALANRPFAVLLEGEAGIGKSRLLREFVGATRRDGLRSLIGVCPPLREPWTLGPVVDAIRDATDRLAGARLSGLAGALQPLFPEWADDLPAAPDPLPDPTAARHRLFRALVELMGWLEVDVLVIDDVHWADDSTIDFLLFLMAQPQPPVSVVAAYRPEEVAADGPLRRLSSRLPSSGLRIALGPLDVGETAAFVSSMLAGEPVSTRFAEFLHRGTDGQPLALEESVRLMHDRADLVRRGGEWVRRPLTQIEVPQTIRDAVLARVARLDADTRAVLNAASVLGDTAGEAALAAVADLPPPRFAAGLASALASGMLAEDERGQLSFRHGLVCRAVYEQLPRPQRRHRHLLAGRWLEQATPLPAIQLVRHFREAGEVADCCRHVQRAVELCRASGDEATASLLLCRLFTSFRLPVGELVRFAGMLSAVARPDQVTEVLGVLEAALREETLSAAERAAIRYQLGRLMMITSEFRTARHHLELASPDLPADSFEAAQVRLFLAVPMGDTRPAAEHLSWLREARIAPSIPSSQRLGLTADRILAYALLGQEPEAWAEERRLPHRAASPTEAHVCAMAWKNLAEAAMHWGRYDEAHRLIRQALEIVDGYEVPRCRAVISEVQARMQWLTGAWDGVAEWMREITEDHGLLPDGRGEAALITGLIHAGRGEDEDAERQLLIARRDAEMRNSTDRLVESAIGLAWLRLNAGDHEGAVRLTDEPMEITIHKGIWMWGPQVVPTRVHALVGLGRLDEAADVVTGFERVLAGATAPAPRAAVQWCRALLLGANDGDRTRAAAQFGAVASVYDAMPRPYVAALARELQAGYLLAAGRDDEGHALLSRVLDTYTGLGARRRARVVRQTLEDRGLLTPPARRPGRPGYGDQLSPREQEVVRLVARGHTNPQIAAALVVSRQTVLSHLRSAMRKLRVTSRTALAVRAIEAGLFDED